MFREAIGYDDGFAKAVYLRQPPFADPLADPEAGLAPGKDDARPAEDRGIQIGWDDEQIVTWMNRQMDAAADAPMGVMGYRVDVRASGAAAWESLVQAEPDVAIGPAALAGATDWRIEIAPNRLMGDTANRSWLPSSMTAWTGRSLLGVDALVDALRGVPPPPGPVRGLQPATALRYGQDHDFRVRFCDLIGGGPGINGAPRNGGPQPVGTLSMRRHIRPTGVSVTPFLPLDPDPAAPPNQITVSRPLLDNPACLTPMLTGWRLPSKSPPRNPAGPAATGPSLS